MASSCGWPRWYGGTDGPGRRTSGQAVTMMAGGDSLTCTCKLMRNGKGRGNRARYAMTGENRDEHNREH